MPILHYFFQNLDYLIPDTDYLTSLLHYEKQLIPIRTDLSSKLIIINQLTKTNPTAFYPALCRLY